MSVDALGNIVINITDVNADNMPNNTLMLLLIISLTTQISKKGNVSIRGAAAVSVGDYRGVWRYSVLQKREARTPRWVCAFWLWQPLSSGSSGCGEAGRGKPRRRHSTTPSSLSMCPRSCPAGLDLLWAAALSSRDCTPLR